MAIQDNFWFFSSTSSPMPIGNETGTAYFHTDFATNVKTDMGTFCRKYGMNLAGSNTFDAVFKMTGSADPGYAITGFIAGGTQGINVYSYPSAGTQVPVVSSGQDGCLAKIVLDDTNNPFHNKWIRIWSQGNDGANNYATGWIDDFSTTSTTVTQATGLNATRTVTTLSPNEAGFFSLASPSHVAAAPAGGDTQKDLGYTFSLGVIAQTPSPPIGTLYLQPTNTFWDDGYKYAYSLRGSFRLEDELFVTGSGTQIGGDTLNLDSFYFESLQQGRTNGNLVIRGVVSGSTGSQFDVGDIFITNTLGNPPGLALTQYEVASVLAPNEIFYIPNISNPEFGKENTVLADWTGTAPVVKLTRFVRLTPSSNSPSLNVSAADLEIKYPTTTAQIFIVYYNGDAQNDFYADNGLQIDDPVSIKFGLSAFDTSDWKIYSAPIIDGNNKRFEIIRTNTTLVTQQQGAGSISFLSRTVAGGSINNKITWTSPPVVSTSGPTPIGNILDSSFSQGTTLSAYLFAGNESIKITNDGGYAKVVGNEEEMIIDYDKWYRLRFDYIPFPTYSICKYYISEDSPGSETWTLLDIKNPASKMTAPHPSTGINPKNWRAPGDLGWRVEFNGYVSSTINKLNLYVDSIDYISEDISD